MKLHRVATMSVVVLAAGVVALGVNALMDRFSGVEVGSSLSPHGLRLPGERVGTFEWTNDVTQVFSGQNLVNDAKEPITLVSVRPERVGPHLKLIGVHVGTSEGLRHQGGFVGYCGVFPPTTIRTSDPAGVQIAPGDWFAVLVAVQNPRMVAEAVEGLIVRYKLGGHVKEQKIYYRAEYKPETARCQPTGGPNF